MGIFSRRSDSRPVPTSSFSADIHDAIAFGARDVVLLSVITFGKVNAGQTAVYTLNEQRHTVKIARIDRDHKRADDAQNGDQVGLIVEGLPAGALPRDSFGKVDTAALQDAVIGWS
ncbi:hypothetical protein [Devriesea agamarum]|uniref:hypothetical protein n=1 Tax=Devriesea agamarum TaxID=472569 RepID=UPI00071DED62|nr:hypothetical protein [Devriesea agamarum]